ncbi:MAG: NADH-quinone oxidoreductase subunit C [Gammaproteobacteria bacterium]|nr:NADH-quinone oxidoreductase subunit C [Gammaproteobacteria bacterium]
MTDRHNKLLDLLRQRLGDRLITLEINRVGEVVAELSGENLQQVALVLRDDVDFGFSQVVDVCGVDYLEYEGRDPALPRFGVVYHLLSYRHNWRLRLRVCLPESRPIIPSMIDVWPGVDWFEREAFDLFGVLFEGHPDLRRILTDYGFVGHPFRKDFPLIGKVEMFYDADQKRVVYKPVAMENRVTVPRVVRQDHRYADLDAGAGSESGG